MEQKDFIFMQNNEEFLFIKKEEKYYYCGPSNRSLVAVEAAFLGGLLTGDASFTKTALGIQLTDIKIVAYVAAKFETNITIYKSKKKQSYKPVYRTFLTRKSRLCEILCWIYLFLGDRQTKLANRLLLKIDPHGDWENAFPTQLIAREHNEPVLLNRFCTDMEFAWLAGYFVTEGHIYIDKRPPIPYPSIVFETTEKDVIEYTSILLCKSYFIVKRPTTAGNILYKTKLNRRTRLRYIFEGILPHLKPFPDVQKEVQGALDLLDRLEK